MTVWVLIGMLQVAGLPAASMDVCALVETLPAPSDPFAQAPPFKKAFTELSKAGRSRRAHKRLHQAFEREGNRLLRRARTLFHPKSGKPKRALIQRFLKRYVYHENPSLIIEGDGFDLTPAVRSALAYTACRLGRMNVAVKHARRPSLTPAALVAYAATLLMQQGREPEARELRPHIDQRGFLGPWVIGMLTQKKSLRRQQIERLSGRARHPVHQEALRVLRDKAVKGGR